MSLTFITHPRREDRLPLGDRVQRVIHAGLDAVPMPAKVRQRIKDCGSCAKRREFLNRLSSPTPPTP